MNGSNKDPNRGSEPLRALLFFSAGLIFLHAVAFPIYWGFGSLMVLGVPEGYERAGGVMIFTFLFSVALLCLSAQFYLASKRGR